MPPKNFSYFGKAFPFLQRQNSCFLCLTPPLLHRYFTGKNILNSLLQKEFYTVSTGFSTGWTCALVEKPRCFRFWKFCVFGELSFPPRFSFFPFRAFFFPLRQKTIFFLFAVFPCFFGARPSKPCHALFFAALLRFCFALGGIWQRKKTHTANR